MGERSDPDDAQFEQFVTMPYGIRAGFIILRRYIRRYGRNTIRKIISSWAPATENKTEAYIAAVCAWMGKDPDDQIKYEDTQTMCALVSAMIRVECGQVVSEDIIIKGYQMA